MVKLYTTNSYFQIFPILNSLIKGTVKEIDSRNIIFSEAKVSLMIERNIVGEFGGSFNTDVYSFGKFLHVKKSIDKLLSKEGSAMAIKRILSEVGLDCFRPSITNLAPSLFDLIIQLKSAKITPEMIDQASKIDNAVLKNKLSDVYKVYDEYEKFIATNGYDDQSSLLTYLPDIIFNDEDIKNADVYLVGYTGFTAQARAIVNALVESAKSVTAILTEGDNSQVFVNETATFIRALCKEKGISLEETKVDSDYTTEGRLIVDNVFSPLVCKKGCIAKATEKIHYLEAKNPVDEGDRVAQAIKQAVISGECRYRDITVAVSNLNEYGDYLKTAFEAQEIPYYLDEKKKVSNHPLVTLVTSYIDAYRKGFERNAVLPFVKNPFFSEDKLLADRFENYSLKYNVNYNRFLSPFVNAQKDEDLPALEGVRESFARLFDDFGINKMLESLSVKEKVEKMTECLKGRGDAEEAAVNEQVYDAVISVLGQMESILCDVKLTLSEYKSIFLGGISALELSIIPQYNDAVFIGGYKETALAKAKMLFVMGLTSSVPAIRQDVALLSDGDINALEEIKVLVEPKISLVNHRTRENVALALGAFSDQLYLSYPTYAIDGGKNVRSEVLEHIEKLFIPTGFPRYNGYITKKQGLKSFARDVSAFAEGAIDDAVLAWSYYDAVDGNDVGKVLEYANTEIKKKLDSNKPLLSGETSPTTVEDFYRCPYKSFLSHALRIGKREEDKVDALSVGNLMHDVFKQYTDNLSLVTSENKSNELFEQISKNLLEKDRYKRFLEEPSTKATVDRVLEESKRYCYKTYLSLKNSKFKVKHTEVEFGDGDRAKYPALPLFDGAIRLKGKIDRVDETDEFFRVLDYKTGTADCTDKELFSGLKLQLFLYAAAVGAVEEAKGKKPAGLYYLPVSDKYENDDKKKETMAIGKTLMDEKALTAQDEGFFENGGSKFTPASVDKKGNVRGVVSEKTLIDYIEYAKKISDLAAQRMSEGVIVASPASGVCEYCDYKGLCTYDDVVVRKVGSVDGGTISDALGGNADGTKGKN